MSFKRCILHGVVQGRLELLVLCNERETTYSLGFTAEVVPRQSVEGRQFAMMAAQSSGTVLAVWICFLTFVPFVFSEADNGMYQSSFDYYSHQCKVKTSV